MLLTYNPVQLVPYLRELQRYYGQGALSVGEQKTWSSACMRAISGCMRLSDLGLQVEVIDTEKVIVPSVSKIGVGYIVGSVMCQCDGAHTRHCWHKMARDAALHLAFGMLIYRA